MFGRDLYTPGECTGSGLLLLTALAVELYRPVIRNIALPGGYLQLSRKELMPAARPFFAPDKFKRHISAAFFKIDRPLHPNIDTSGTVHETVDLFNF